MVGDKSRPRQPAKLVQPCHRRRFQSSNNLPQYEWAAHPDTVTDTAEQTDNEQACQQCSVLDSHRAAHSNAESDGVRKIGRIIHSGGSASDRVCERLSSASNRNSQHSVKMACDRREVNFLQRSIAAIGVTVTR